MILPPNAVIMVMMEAVLAAVMAAVTVTAEDIELKEPGVEKISQPFWAGLSLFTPVLKNMDRFGMLSYPRLVLRDWLVRTRGRLRSTA